jgi:hypothetical protein
VTLQAVSPGQVPAVSGTLSRIPTAAAGGQNAGGQNAAGQNAGQGGAIATATAPAGGGVAANLSVLPGGSGGGAGGGGAGGGAGGQTIPAPATATPPVRAPTPVQPTLAVPR